MFAFLKRNKKEEQDKSGREDNLYTLAMVRKNIRTVENSIVRDYREDFKPKEFNDVTGEMSHRLQLSLEVDKKYLKSCVVEYMDNEGLSFVQDPSGLYSELVKYISMPRTLSSPAKEILDAMDIPGRFETGIDVALNYYAFDRETQVNYSRTGPKTIMISMKSAWGKEGVDFGFSNYEQAKISQSILGMVEQENQALVNKMKGDLFNMYVKN